MTIEKDVNITIMPNINYLNDIHHTVKFGQNCTIRKFIYIGEGTVMGDNVKIANHCDIGKHCKIGNNVNLQTGVVLNDYTVVGDNTFMAGRVTMADEKYPAVGRQVRRPSTIGSNCVLGLGCVIVACDVGDNAVVGANSVVFDNIPAGEVWAGNPAKPIMIGPPLEQWKMTRTDYDMKKSNWEAKV